MTGLKKDRAVIVLAAGLSTRFKSERTKVLHPILGKPILQYVIDAVTPLKPKQITVVVSPKAIDSVLALLGTLPITCVTQPDPLGTANAVDCASAELSDFDGYVLITAGDVPFIQTETVEKLMHAVEMGGELGGVISFAPNSPTGYGRMVRSDSTHVESIVEERDATDQERKIGEVNSSIYYCHAKWLFEGLKKIKPKNSQGEFYLTDIVSLAAQEGRPFLCWRADQPDEFLGINDRVDLAQAEKWERSRVNSALMRNGVTLIDPDSTFIDGSVLIGSDTVIGPNVTIKGETVIGDRCLIEQGSVIHDSRLMNGAVIHPYSVIDQAKIRENAIVGPFARLRPGAVLDESVKVGNFVEVKKSHLKKGVKANHLSYIGDAVIGKNTNVGCGTITCNYDGKNKHQTIIGDNVMVGSDVAFVAPVEIGNNVTIGAGSVITENVPDDSLAIARSRQVNKQNWKRD